MTVFYYRIALIDEDYQQTGQVSVRIQHCHTGQWLTLLIQELVQEKWLKQFSHEDKAQIAALHHAQQTQNWPLIDQLPKRHALMRPGAWIISILFAGFLVLSNLAAFKLTAIGPLILPAATIFFPMTYVFDDILTEVYGFKMSRRIIWFGLLVNSFVILGLWLTTYLPAAPNWAYQSAYAAVYQGVPRVFIASAISYVCGEFINSWLLAKLKVKMHGKYLYVRAVASTAAGVSIDTLLFIHLAFYGLIPYGELWQAMLSLYAFKLFYELCAAPLTYKIANYLKKKDNIDYYDINTQFTPFSLKLD